MIGRQADWKPTRLRFLLDEIDQRVGSPETELPLLSVSIHRGVLPRSEITDREARADDFVSYKHVEPGDIVINRMRAFEGGAGLSEFRGIVSSDYAVLRPRGGLEPRFLHHLIRSHWLVGEMTARLRGIGNAELGNVRTPRINVEDLGNIVVSLPTAEAQRAIADYLDAETTRIDRATENLRVANDLLKERLAAAIESIIWRRVESVLPLMRLTQDDRQIQYGIVLPGPDVDDGVPIVKGGNLLTGALKASGLAKTTREIEAGYARSRLRAGDVAFAIRGAVGACALVPNEVEGANITQDVAMIAPRNDVDPMWLLYALRSPSVQGQAEARILGATIRGINIRDLKRLRVPGTHLSRQRQQAYEIQRLQLEHDSLVAARARQADLLLERRQAVITAAVTGEFDLPGVAA